MSTLIVNVKTTKKCAFCKNWYDPTNSAIEPRNPKINLWKIKDTNQKSTCMKKNLKMYANSFCSNYECKL